MAFSGLRSTGPLMIVYLNMVLGNMPFACEVVGGPILLAEGSYRSIESRPRCDLAAFRRQHEGCCSVKYTGWNIK